MGDLINIFVLAAGLGERLLPITSHIPKPLLPVAGKPVLQIILEKLSGLPIRNIGVNIHHKMDLIQEWISLSDFRKSITPFVEPVILGTGGALRNAQEFLSEGEFLVHNADIISDIDLGGLIAEHRETGNIATLAVHDFPRFNTVSIDAKGFLNGVGIYTERPSAAKSMAFTGVAVYDPDFLRFLPAGVSSVVDAWMAAIASGRSIGTLDVTGSYWTDIGTPSAYASAVAEHLRSRGESVFIHPSSRGCSGADIDGYVTVEERSIMGQGVSIRNCIVLPDTNIALGISHRNCIIGPDFEILLDEEDFVPSSGDACLRLIGAGGSDRKYYRVHEKEGPSVLMKFFGDEADFDRQIIYTEFFGRFGVPVPALLRVDKENMEAVFEDLGDLSLYSWLKCRRSREETERIYRKAIDVAVTLHTEVTSRISECPALKDRSFDYEHLRWETRHFIDNFVSTTMNIEIPDASALDQEFHRLAAKVDSFHKAAIHRDFQSQNIMITKGDTLRLIDYQGARTGPPAYDIASLLWDPYYRLDDDVRDSLIDYYIETVSRRGIGGFNKDEFRDTILPCRLQRHMQALGAYGFLSMVKNKRYFLKHVGEGVRLLREEAGLVKNEYPALYNLVDELWQCRDLCSDRR